MQLNDPATRPDPLRQPAWSVHLADCPFCRQLARGMRLNPTYMTYEQWLYFCREIIRMMENGVDIQGACDDYMTEVGNNPHGYQV